MTEVTGKVIDGTVNITLEGRVDTSNAAEVEQKINDIIGDSAAGGCVIDCEKLEYISSAGLRVILRLRKRFPELRAVGCSSEVYDIFEMTGFTEMITVEKAYRKVSIDGCEIIGQGAKGSVYRIDEETIVKVYNNPDSLDDIRHEREVARKALILGIPTAISYDVVKVGDSYASMFELLNAKSFAKLISSDPDGIDGYISMYVDLLKKIHATEVPQGDLPDYRDTVRSWVAATEGKLPEDVFGKLKKMTDEIPYDCHMIHGDYHLKNVMYQDGEVLLIDMDTLAVGCPLFEFVSIFNAYQGFSLVDHTVVEGFMGITYEQATYIWNRTISLYLGTDDEETCNAFKDRVMLLSAVRIFRRSLAKDSGNRALIDKCYEMIIDLSGRVDSLV